VLLVEEVLLVVEFVLFVPEVLLVDLVEPVPPVIESLLPVEEVDLVDEVLLVVEPVLLLPDVLPVEPPFVMDVLPVDPLFVPLFLLLLFPVDPSPLLPDFLFVLVLSFFEPVFFVELVVLPVLREVLPVERPVMESFISLELPVEPVLMVVVP
jgi:hypothetical protein